MLAALTGVLVLEELNGTGDGFRFWPLVLSASGARVLVAGCLVVAAVVIVVCATGWRGCLLLVGAGPRVGT